MAFEERLMELCERVSGCRTLEGLDRLASQFARELGVDGFYYVAYDPHLTTRFIWIDRRDPEWVRLYRTRNMIIHDPVTQRNVVQTRPFFWDAALEGRVPNREEREIFALARDFRLNDGYSIPIHGTEMRRAAFCFYTERSQELRGAVAEREGVINAFAYLFHARAKALSTPEKSAPRLSPREREVLSWAAAGKSNDEIAEILAISKGTVNAHIRSAAEKLGTYTKTQTVARAAFLHLILV